jgi:hypothetical protein
MAGGLSQYRIWPLSSFRWGHVLLHINLDSLAQFAGLSAELTQPARVFVEQL